MIEQWLDSIVHMDCIAGMRSLPGRSLDLIIADPPYNVSKGNNWAWDRSADLPGFGGEWRKMMEEWDDMPLSEYLNFTLTWLRQAKRILKPTGSIWVHGTYHNIGITNVAFQLLGIEIINEIVWYKRNAFPNLSGRRFTASHETILWGHTGGTKRQYYFDYQGVKEGSFPEDLLKKPGKQMRTVWDIPNNKTRDELRFATHPAQKPLRLLCRMITASAPEGALCLAPFAGSGSECVAAKKTRRHFIGFETEGDYVESARQRVAATEVAPMQPPSPGEEYTKNGSADSTPAQDVDCS